MNILLSCVPELLITEIGKYLSYRHIKSLCSTCQTLYKWKSSMIDEKLKITNGYPRIEGKYKRHVIPREIIDNKMRGYTNDSLRECMKMAMDKNIVTLDLIKGDIVEFQPDILGRPKAVIFNGSNLEEMEYNSDGEEDVTDDYGVIVDDVPINYYDDTWYSIKFNLKKVENQLLDNLFYGGRWSTTFNYNNQQYCIFYCANKETIEEQKIKFIEELTSGNPALSYASDFGPYAMIIYESPY